MKQMRDRFKILSEMLVGGDHFEDQGVDKKKILMCAISGVGCVNWLYLSQDRC
jgi:hypothetical protein